MPFSSCHDISTQFCFNPPGDSTLAHWSFPHRTFEGLGGLRNSHGRTASSMTVKFSIKWDPHIWWSSGVIGGKPKGLHQVLKSALRMICVVMFNSHWDTACTKEKMCVVIGIIRYHEYVGRWGCYLCTLFACLWRIYSQIKPWREEKTICMATIIGPQIKWWYDVMLRWYKAFWNCTILDYVDVMIWHQFSMHEESKLKSS